MRDHTTCPHCMERHISGTSYSHYLPMCAWGKTDPADGPEYVCAISKDLCQATTEPEYCPHKQPVVENGEHVLCPYCLLDDIETPLEVNALGVFSCKRGCVFLDRESLEDARNLTREILESEIICEA